MRYPKKKLTISETGSHSKAKQLLGDAVHGGDEVGDLKDKLEKAKVLIKDQGKKLKEVTDQLELKLHVGAK